MSLEDKVHQLTVAVLGLTTAIHELTDPNKYVGAVPYETGGDASENEIPQTTPIVDTEDGSREKPVTVITATASVQSVQPAQPGPATNVTAPEISLKEMQDELGVIGRDLGPNASKLIARLGEAPYNASRASDIPSELRHQFLEDCRKIKAEVEAAQ